MISAKIDIMAWVFRVFRFVCVLHITARKARRWRRLLEGPYVLYVPVRFSSEFPLFCKYYAHDDGIRRTKKTLSTVGMTSTKPCLTY